MIDTSYQELKVLITVKTYPIPSSKYEELVCTAGVTESGDFIRLYPINFRDLEFSKQYRKYQWIRIFAQRHTGRDARKESYRPDCDTLRILGEPISTSDNWARRAKYVLKNAAASMEELRARQELDRTSLGIFKPEEIYDLEISSDDTEWNPAFIAKLQQMQLWETRKASREPPRKVPFKFHYRFRCNDPRCKGHHQMIEDWEVGALYWRMVDQGASPREASLKVRQKFLDELCSASRDTYFYVGTILKYPKSWVVIGVFYPKKEAAPGSTDGALSLPLG